MIESEFTPSDADYRREIQALPARDPFRRVARRLPTTTLAEPVPGEVR